MILRLSDCNYIASDDCKNIKDIEFDYFFDVKVKYSRLFGPSLNNIKAGIVDITMTPNKCLIAASLTDGALLIFDAYNFDLLRIHPKDHSNPEINYFTKL